MRDEGGFIQGWALPVEETGHRMVAGKLELGFEELGSSVGIRAAGGSREEREGRGSEPLNLWMERNH